MDVYDTVLQQTHMGTGPVISHSRCSGTCRCVAKQTGQCLLNDAKSCQNRSPQLRQTAVNISKPLYFSPLLKRNVTLTVTIKHMSHMTNMDPICLGSPGTVAIGYGFQITLS